jgi:hypothetical protein
VLGIVPLSRICVTPKASLGFHQAYYDKVWTFGLKITSDAGTDELLSYGLRVDVRQFRNVGRDLAPVGPLSHLVDDLSDDTVKIGHGVARLVATCGQPKARPVSRPPSS